ncbi:hypothetical protein, variant 4 [Batrachochytrium dendrobatidis JEL423]|uniref:PB1 domain-containing protein n=1 Tax=Batrachochytrium dendrobatidis (strain JEL423) TaxID=403673 RepID=A0A177WB36_BATDL|nr:hypothetical protein BDEG_20942 [Batrachochytrium dendrobatidis JEL423]OAJ36811.1 hypothetical protein, variant 1 [Batrachochytrium dendrobatidis JEL423]OAJ36812.1 hypothetical protein, variant 2 [Batrachochytrium dendrobatidis JEL423]OAJ36813.1 hypothetical protein, variant 3 [Batrachochytrium dendrobatidis JEL423]OAJ36814.1 hypothetical protein, variant 4 [Batrachochytrium dendrobatidis JEL423]
MSKRYLNVEYAGTRTRIDITDFEDLSDAQDAIKAKYGPAMADIGAPQLQLYDQQGQLIADLDDIAIENTPQYYKKRTRGGSCVVIGVLPLPPRQPTQTDLDSASAAASTSHLPAEEGSSHKRQRTEPESESEPDNLTARLKSFANAQLVDECIQSTDHVFFPYTQDKIQKLYVRECYKDVFELLLKHISPSMESFAISGTPGIGKSLFFVYILYRLMDDFAEKTLSLKPNRIVYQMGSTYKCFDLQQQLVTRTTEFDAEELVWKQDTFYVIDGRTSEPLASSCIVLFISSPRSEWYKEFVKQKMAKEWYFPVWTLDELQTCRLHCYPGLKIEMLQERHRICGGVARFVFHNDYSIPVPKKMLSALADVNAAVGVKYVGETTDIFPASHTLLQILVGDDEFGNTYQFTDLDVASEYVGEQLWQLRSSQMITNLQEMFGGAPNEISRHLFEIYGHVVFSTGRKTLKCRCLEDGKATKITLDALNSQRTTFGKNTIPTAAALNGNYYEPTDDDNFPAIDSLSQQGMFQFTVAAEHPIRGVDILTQLCNLYDEPKLYFVVPPHRFKGFKKQTFKAKKGTEQVQPIPGLKQYVIKLPLM